MVTSTIAGSAVAGNSGGVGEGETETQSEVVKESDGSCAGWPGRSGGTWTAGLVEGARIVVVDPSTGARVGTGRLGRGRSVDVDPSGNAQWDCVFPFTATVRGRVPTTLRLVVAGARPMTAHPDPTTPGHVVASVSTDAKVSLVDACAAAPAAEPGLWDRAVGVYWNAGLDQICGAGVGVARIQRVCRPRTIGSDHVVAVLKPDDPSVVYEDASGLAVSDIAALGPSPRVLVRVATGQPCG